MKLFVRNAVVCVRFAHTPINIPFMHIIRIFGCKLISNDILLFHIIVFFTITYMGIWPLLSWRRLLHHIFYHWRHMRTCIAPHYSYIYELTFRFYIICTWILRMGKMLRRRRRHRHRCHNNFSNKMTRATNRWHRQRQSNFNNNATHTRQVYWNGRSGIPNSNRINLLRMCRVCNCIFDDNVDDDDDDD